MNSKEGESNEINIWRRYVIPLIIAILGISIREVGRMSHYDVLIYIGWLTLILAVILLVVSINSIIRFKRNEKEKEEKRRKEHEELKNELEEEKKKLQETQKNYIWTDLHELNNLVSEYEKLIDPNYKGVLKRLANELYEQTTKRYWNAFVDDYRRIFENIDQFKKKVEDNVKNGISNENEFIILITEFNQQIGGFIGAVTIFVGLENVEKSEPIKEKYNNYCGLFNAFLDKYDIFQISMVVKYKDKYNMHTINRITKIENKSE